MKQLIAPMPYGAHQTNKLPIEERRWAVKVFPRGAPAQYVLSIQLPLPKLPMQGWAAPSVRSLDELPKYFQLTEKFEAALLFESPQDALMEAFQIEEFGVEADIVEVDGLNEDGELVAQASD